MRSIRNGLLACLLLWSGTAAAKEHQTYPERGVQSFLGLDDTSSTTQVQDGRAQTLQNITLGVDHSIRKRFGIKLIGGTLDIPDETDCTVEGGAYAKFSSGTERIVALCGNRFYYLNSSNVWTQVPGNGSAGFTAGANNQFVFTIALDKLVGTNGINIPLQWGGGVSENYASVVFTGLTNSIQKANAVAFFKNYLIFGNTTEVSTAYPTRIRWSNVGLINTWTDADYIDIDSLGGQTLQALVPFYDQLYAFFSNSIYRISLVGGSQTFQVARVTEDIGTLSKNSIRAVTLGTGQKGLMFMDRRKRVYFFDGTTALDVSQLIRTTMDGLSGTQLPYAVSDNTGTSYLLCAANSGKTANDQCVEFQTQILEWTKHSNLPANAMWHVLDSSGNDQTYFGSYRAFVYQLSDSSLKSDVGGVTTSTVQAVNNYTTATASGLTVLYTNAAAMTTGALAGAPILLVGGTGAGLLNTVATNTATGIVVTDAYSTTPDTTTTYEVGGIDAFYRTKWYDYGYPARIKNGLDLDFWADADTSSTLSISYAWDFNADTATTSKQLSAGSDNIWNTAIWNTATWGGGVSVFLTMPLSNEGRYLDFKFANDNPNESFKLYGYVPIFDVTGEY